MRTILFLFFSAALVIGTGCGDDGGGTDTSTGDTSTGDTSTGDTSTGDTSTGDTSTGDTGTGDTGTGDTGTGDGGGDGGGGDGGGDGGGASAAAVEYCSDYEGECGFAMRPARFDNADACTAFYDAAETACTACLGTHLGLAADDADTHCPHATGLGDPGCAADCGG